MPSPTGSGRTPHSEAIDAQRGLTHAHRHALAFLATSAHARVELHVVADHADLFERFGAAAFPTRAFEVYFYPHYAVVNK